MQQPSDRQTSLNLPTIAKNATAERLHELTGGQRSEKSREARPTEKPTCTPLGPIARDAGKSQANFTHEQSRVEGQRKLAGPKSGSKLPVTLTKSKSKLINIDSQPSMADVQKARENEGPRARAQNSALGKPGQ